MSRLVDDAHVVATRTAAFLTQAWNSPSVEGVHAPRDLRVGQKITDPM